MGDRGKKSETAEYMAAKKILDYVLSNIELGIIVRDVESGRVVFANEKASSDIAIETVIRETYDEAIVNNGKLKEGFKYNNVKYYSKYGRWFEVRLKEMAWVDAKSVVVATALDVTDSKRQDKRKYNKHEEFIKEAVETRRDEFVLFYQPLVDANTKECISCEALIRWDSKSLGFLYPGDFIPMAEYLGLITTIGEYVMETACIQCKDWNDRGFKDFRVSVNLSVVQLMQFDIVDSIKEIIERTEVDPSNIYVEVTESFAINDMERVIAILKALKGLGIKIALDDFGTGYSSLNYIKRLPLDIIKIDKTFIDDIIEDEYSRAFVKLIVDLSKTLKTKVVAEGVETEEQYIMLRDFGVDYIQGFYFGKPIDAISFEKENLSKLKKIS
ncbi:MULTISPECIES: putative bifunctional diguanylate cyclase/phosphodiesterase [Lachnospira]|uniref:EAL domain, c-di-GMP-specific phosphodiesterase class I (Or its enzymatically inactive variant) n=1 Tax=Lachnospira pectinoschiza TaxID=28052 RepID=A0A1G9Y3P3_9FIRM|nr:MULTISPECIES: EAL domain-containing protein [Lachnospira]SDN03734.1 EAL domain, c-di-GMP-specific phosphodiesterase class I (or its enzymatically inactive variant) [Lachnospira pectinoschiza]